MSQRSYFDAMEYDAMIAEYGRPETFVDDIARMQRDKPALITKRAFPECRFLCMEDTVLSAALGWRGS